MLLLLALMFLAVTDAAFKPPHIVTIVADDLGWDDVGFHGSNEIPTPNIDALAFSGIVLNRHYTMATCTPSRASLMTGVHPIRTGMQGFPMKAGEPRALPLQVPTLPERLTELGYDTRMVGKWHIGYMRSNYTPSRRGFRSHLGYWNGYIGYFDHGIDQIVLKTGETYYGHDLWRDTSPAWDLQGRYATDVFTDEAVRIISQHGKAQPLYLHVAHLAVHSGNVTNPLEVPDPAETHRRFSYIKSPERRLFAGMLTRLDDSVGKIVDALRNKKMLDNSIIVFISDNGGQTIGLYNNTASNWPMRGMKMTLFEGGVRGVAAVWSPLLKDRRRTSSQLMHLVDWLPTLYSAAGGDVGHLGPIDGVDQWPSLSRSFLPTPRHEMPLNIDERRDNWAYISGKWKLVGGSYENGFYDVYAGYDTRGALNPAYNVSAVLARTLDPSLTKDQILELRKQSTIPARPQWAPTNLGSPPCPVYCLFDLDKDPWELMDVSAVYPHLTSILWDRLVRFSTHLRPQLDTDVDPASNPDHFNGSWVPWLENVTTPLFQELFY